MPHWCSFPLEIRHQILELLAEEKSDLGSYASVCKEWQAVIERKNFRQLNLQISCLDDLEQMVNRNKGLVKHIWLNIELESYTCQTYEPIKSFFMGLRDAADAGQAIIKLYSILSTWDDMEDLTLEITAQSPSDLEHWFQDWYFGVRYEDDGAVNFQTGNRPREETTTHSRDPEHGWIEHGRATIPGREHVLRIFEPLRVRLYAKELSEVRAVTCFVIRRQCRRQFTPADMRLLLHKLPRLRSLVYEPWHPWSSMEKRMVNWEFETFIDKFLPRGLRKISIFQDFKEDYVSLFPDLMNEIQVSLPLVSRACAFRSLDLEHVALSFMVDAWDFFGARQSQWTWSNLKSLALTSSLLSLRTEDRTEISKLLKDAGTAALCMPRLRTMALWNGRRREACAFMYRNEGDNPSVSWKGTWEMDLAPGVVQAWERVASKYTQGELRVEKKLLVCDTASSHGDTISLLELPEGVINPVSLWQIQKEGLTGWQPQEEDAA